MQASQRKLATRRKALVGGTGAQLPPYIGNNQSTPHHTTNMCRALRPIAMFIPYEEGPRHNNSSNATVEGAAGQPGYVAAWDGTCDKFRRAPVRHVWV
eukprot:74521-Chlamydomonas_euryale.AAC.2